MEWTVDRPLCSTHTFASGVLDNTERAHERASERGRERGRGERENAAGGAANEQDVSIKSRLVAAAGLENTGHKVRR